MPAKIQKDEIKKVAQWLLSLPVQGGYMSSPSAQRVILLSIILNEGKPITFKELSESCGIGERTLYRAIEELELMNLIRRENNGSEKNDKGTIFSFTGKI